MKVNKENKMKVKSTIFNSDSRYQLWTFILSYNYAIKSFLERKHVSFSQLHCFSLENITFKQQQKIKSSIIDANNYFNGVFSSFNFLNSEFYPEHRLIDVFSSCFSFHKVNYYLDENKTAHCNKLNELIFNALSNPNIVIIISDTSIKNNITSIEAELFAIRCGINQVVQIPSFSHIVVITDVLYIV